MATKKAAAGRATAPARRDTATATAAKLIEQANIASAGDVFDADALFAELAGGGYPFAFRGEQFVIHDPATWGDGLMLATRSDEVIAAVRKMMGADRYDRFVELGGGVVFLQRIIESVFGISLGGSSASSQS